MGMNFVESLFRWLHVVAGIVWIGHLYFFNFVNGPFQTTIDGDTKRKVNPELLPRALFWFRWGAAFTWVTGVFLLLMVYYHGRQAFEGPEGNWNAGALVMIALTFLGVFVYDIIYRSVLTAPAAGFWGGLALSAAMVFAYDYVAGFGFRGYSIHLAGLFGSIMAYNVWFQIWPAQQQI
ncbi:MAG TPA: urate hydroxylase PuuD, partial [Terriglobales bacterium]|nr:urate hydroxylase PuuD [Terriglobales bacterium]